MLPNKYVLTAYIWVMRIDQDAMSNVSVVLLFICWLRERVEGGGSGRDRSVVKFHLIHRTKHRLAYRTHYFSGINDHRPILCFALMASVYFDPTHLYRLFLSFYPRGLFPSQLLPSDHARPRTRIATEALRVTKISCACPLN